MSTLLTLWTNESTMSASEMRDHITQLMRQGKSFTSNIKVERRIINYVTLELLPQLLANPRSSSDVVQQLVALSNVCFGTKLSDWLSQCVAAAKDIDLTLSILKTATL